MTSTTFGKKYTFYNAKVAINFQAVVSKSHFNTINVEMTTKNAEGQVDWKKNKISLQLSEVDAFKVFYCIINDQKLRYESKFHGSENRKSIQFIENDTGGCNIQLKDNGNVLFFELSPGQWFYAKLLLTEQLLGLPVSIEDTKKLMYTPTNPDKEKAIFESTPLGESLADIKTLLSDLTTHKNN
jgi:hypothetical protein